MNAKSLRNKLFSELGEFLIDEYTSVIKGEGDFSSNSVKAREDVFDILKEVILKESDTKKIIATSTESVLKLLRRGKITLEEAERLMKIMQTDFEITELPKLLEKFESLNK